jgi:hypothetical protein
MDRADQQHWLKRPQQQPEQVALVVVCVPDGNPQPATEAQQPGDHGEVERPPVR